MSIKINFNDDFMTDNEIMRALEFFKSGKDENFAFVSGNALDLINRQKAENERLKAHLEELAYKEFAERLKQEIRDTRFAYEAEEQCECIDNILKKWLEVVNEKN